METVPVALTMRWISTGAPAVSRVQDGRAGGGPTSQAPKARSRGKVDADDQPRLQRFQMLSIDAQVHGNGVNPQSQRASGPRWAQPELLATPRSCR
jgi:hypothetical protein